VLKNQDDTRAMIDPPDLQADALATFESFASRCEGRLSGEVFDGLIAVAAHVLNEAAKIIHADDPALLCYILTER
jgi:hypothetical protein